MKVSPQLVNLLGIVVTAAILVAGVAFVALPLYGDAQTTESEVRTVVQTNDVYAIEVNQLEADADHLPEILSAVETLRTGIPGRPQLDDVHEVVNLAAQQAGAVVVSVVATGPDAWSARTQIGHVPGEADPASPPSDGASATAGATEPSGGAASTPDPPAPDGTAPGAATPVEDELVDLPPQQQVTVTITVQVPDATSAAAFLEILRGGSRLIGIDTAALAPTEEGPLELVINAFAFLRAEN